MAAVRGSQPFWLTVAVGLSVFAFCAPAIFSDRELVEFPTPVFALYVAATLGAGLTGYLLVRHVRPKPVAAAPLAYEPPEGLSPLQAAIAWNGQMPDSAPLATVLHLAELGLVTIRLGPMGPRVTGVVDPAGWARVDEVSMVMADRFGWPAGETHDLHATTYKARRRREVTARRMEQAAVAWATREDLVSKTRHLGFPGLLVILGLWVGLFGGPVLHLTQPSLWGFPFLAFALMGTGVFKHELILEPTGKGRQIREQVAGFRRTLATPGALERMEFAKERNLYLAYTPWAVVLGCAEEWEQAYVNGFGTPPEPGWLAGGSLKTLMSNGHLIEQPAETT